MKNEGEKLAAPACFCRGEERKTPKPKSNAKEPRENPESPEGTKKPKAEHNNRQRKEKGEEVGKLEVQLCCLRPVSGSHAQRPALSSRRA